MLRPVARPLSILLLGGALAALGTAPTAAEAAAAGGRGTSRTAPLPSDEELERRGAVIGHIVIRSDNVFDPTDRAEDHRLYRVANRIHRVTRPQAIESQLPFRPGDRYSRLVLDEAERLLRARPYLSDATVRPLRCRGDTVDVEVVTKDVWTMKAGLSLGRSGGENHTRFTAEDLNLLGSGKSLAVVHDSNVDRTSAFLSYEDPNVLSSRVRLRLHWGDNSDGFSRQLEVGHPFFALDSRWSVGVRLTSEERTDARYTLGRVSEQLAHRITEVEAFGGLSHGRTATGASRWTLGFTYRSDDLAPAGDETTLAAPTTRTLVYPWVAYDRIADDYREEHNLDQMGRTEDLALGPRLHARLGLSTTALGASRDELVVDALASRGLAWGEDRTLLLAASASGRWGDGGLANALMGGSARYLHRDLGDQLLMVRFEAELASNLDPERQLLLGGDSGLRGYPLRYQEGDARALLTVEQRVYTGIYPFHLFRLGAAAFLDVGRTWGNADPGASQGLLRDLGVGLRLASTRSGHGSVIHLDLAVPLDGDPTIRSVQWLVRTRTAF